MATSEVEICNLALTEAFCANISSLSAASREAEVCNQYYGHCRDLMLSGYNWKFNQVRRTLAVSTEEVPTDWAFAYEMPTNCLQAVKIFQPIRPSNYKIPFSIECKENSEEKILYTDEPDAILVYRKKITNVSMFSPTFTEALVQMLAAKAAMGIKQDINLSNVCLINYWQAVSRGTILDAAANEDDSPPDTEILKSRV